MQWRTLHNEALRALLTKYCADDPIKNNEMGGAWGRRIVGEIEGKKPLGRSSRRWEDIKTDVRGCDGVDWIHVGQDGLSGGLLLTYSMVQSPS